MNKVVTINLNGRAYQLEEDGYADLKKYLSQAEHSLAGDPDKDEIIADFQQAIAEKFDQVLSATKTVVTEAEIADIVRQMGPVDGESLPTEEDDPASQPKRFYLIKEGSVIGGVCTGIAAYFNVDVTVVRFLMIILAFITSGAIVAAYVVIMLLAPEATTPEQKAQAHGREFKTKELLETARRKYALIGDKKHWQQFASATEPNLSRLGSKIRAAMRIVSAVIAVVGAGSLVGLVVVGTASTLSVLASGQLFGVMLDPTISQSLAALFVACALVVGVIPVLIITITAFKYAKNGSAKQSMWGLVAALSLFAVALSVCLAIISTTPQIRDVSNFHMTDTHHNGRVLCLGYCY